MSSTNRGPPFIVFRTVGPVVGHDSVGRLNWQTGQPPDGPLPSQKQIASIVSAA